MKTREQKQKDLTALTEQLQTAKSAMIIGFNKLTVTKDQEFRNRLREAGAKYQVVKNTIVRRAAEGTAFESANEYFKGVTGIAWTEADGVDLSKTVSKFVKDNSEIYSFKAGVVDGKVVDLKQVEAIASLPSKEELISKLLFVLNSQAQRLVTVINAVPRDLAIVIKQIGEKLPDTPAAAATDETPAETAAAAEEAPAAAIEETREAAAAPVAEESASAESASAETENAPEAVAATEEKSE